ncbi:hypothetical protein DL766_001029 [Monosporascus sp. MC13-8B]|nr:hypothetical protein DL763_010673 [Monosporascus cannonballus]RYP38320.1 hypothetical protein DL766_001029 [Monosporascus sp. MC13-8B]
MPLNDQQTLPRDSHTPSTLSTASRPQSPLYDSSSASRPPSPRTRSRSRTPLRRSRSAQPPSPPRPRYTHSHSHSHSTHPPLHFPPYPSSTPSPPPLPPLAQTSRSKHLSSSTTTDDQHRRRRRRDRRRSSSAHSSGSLTRGEKLKSSLAFLGTVAAATYLMHKAWPKVFGDEKDLKGIKGKTKEVVGGREDGERDRERDRGRNGGRGRDRDRSVIRDIVVEERFRNGRPEGRRVYDDGRLVLDEGPYDVRHRRSVDGHLGPPRHRRFEIDDDDVVAGAGR